jgi:pilus assembly protein CpaB
MGSKSILILAAAVVCGLVAMFGTSQLLARKDKPPEMRDVVVADRDLKAEEIVKADALRVVKMNKEVAPVGCFSSPQEIEGRWIQIPTLKDEPIIAAKLAPKDSPPGLIGRIPDGMRAFAVEVNEQTGVSGFILPDHRVDVIQDLRDDRSPNVKRKARMILQNVQVLAAGQLISRPEDKSIVVRTVTLAVTPEQVEILVSARAKGPLSLALRGLDDGEIVAIEEPEPEPKPEPKVEPKPEPPPAPVVVAAVPRPTRRPRHVVIHHGIRRTELVRAGYAPGFDVVAPATAPETAASLPPAATLPPALDPPPAADQADAAGESEAAGDNSAALARDFGG